MVLEELKKIKSTKKDLRGFGLAVGGVLAAIGLLLLWRHSPSYPYFISIGAVLVISGLIYPSILKPFQKAWMAFAVVMGWVMTRVILLMLFFLVVTPIGLIMRILGKRPISLEWRTEERSYWNPRQRKPFDPSGCEKQF